MKKIIIILFIILITSYISFGQEVSCKDLIEYVETKGYYKGSVNSLQLINSSWLKEVKAYSIENTIVVIAEIKIDELGFNTKKYIFCGISNYNWEAFYYGFSDLDKSFGERFNKYIIDYKCNCSE